MSVSARQQPREWATFALETARSMEHETCLLHQNPACTQAQAPTLSPTSAAGNEQKPLVLDVLTHAFFFARVENHPTKAKWCILALTQNSVNPTKTHSHFQRRHMDHASAQSRLGSSQ